MTEKMTIKKLKKHLGTEIGLSDWFEVTQDQINDFARLTKDEQWIHVDADKAAQSPLGGTVAHGLLLLSLIPYLSRNSMIFSYDSKMMVNYGLDRVRFIHPVQSGSDVRNRAVLKKVEKKGFRRILAHIQNTLEIKGQKKPALVADCLVLFYN
ncbi:MAG: MaoC family dehydratase [Candidatus Aminicenantes bacterium]|nr:MaoC family dehydratase [Candidatus Aminicenantes bacterium]